jgi:ubiquinone/menaquinone biosynthesis C-methylase UbiE
MSTAFSTETLGQLSSRLSVPQRLEIQTVLRILQDVNLAGKACLDIGFGTPVASRMARTAGGFWTSVVRHEGEVGTAAAFLDEDVTAPGPAGELPFEDKQFDVVVVGHGCLTGDFSADAIALRECHRILKVGGLIVLTVEFKKPLGIAYLLNGRRLVSRTGGCYSEAALFELMKSGFDVLGIRHFCRFWVQLVRQWADRRQRQYGEHDTRLSLTSILYPLAAGLDVPLCGFRGYLLTACGRRKGWRPREKPTLSDGRSIQECVLHGFVR